MNIIQEKQAVKRFMEGESVENITRDMGISEEQLCAALNARLNAHKGAVAKFDRMVFPNLARLIRDGHVSVRRLAMDSKMTYSNMYKLLIGVHEPRLHTIENILAATGMTFEEAFARKEEPDAHT